MGKNREIGEIFDNIADMLDILEENQFRVRAYRNAARNIEELGDDIEEVAERDELTEIPGVGPDLADKIREYIATGNIKDYEDLKKKVPGGLVKLLAIQGLGPKTIGRLHRELGVTNLEDLQRVLEGGEILKLRGMGGKKVQDMKRGIAFLKQSGKRTLLGVAFPVAEEILRQIEGIPGTDRTVVAGSFRRMKETVGDFDILTIADNGEEVIENFTKLPPVKEVLTSGDTKGSVILKNGVQVDLLVMKPDSYGAALVYFTGSRDHTIKLRTIAQRKGLRINEYGIFRGDKKVAGETEEDVYEALGLPWMPPEIREDRGEIEAAFDGRLPNLVEPDDIKGDLHMHSKWSDGKGTIEEMVLSAKKMGYEYVAITDHSPSSRIAGGLSVESLYEKKKEVEAVKKKVKGIKVLMGAEVDIKSDGSLDYPDDVLRDLDVVLVSIHSGFKMDRDSMTARIIKAVKNPLSHVLTHPTGRLIGEREAYQVDIDEVIRAVKKYGKAIEVNSHYMRLDLNDINVKKAIDSGTKILISTDSHHPNHLGMMRLGVATARRGWAGKEDVLNTVPFDELSKWLSEVRNSRD
ncbi:MAG TPA: DNA polymerase/3'-5' exonuclease PolX [Thermodesulfobacteriota bacterium]|nr:DNA polymerase/3'-5' exonuclease PolX [Thermodesulfobacteriota bacterium]